MGALRLSWTVAGNSAADTGAFQLGDVIAAGGSVSPSATSDLIGVVPLNPATLTPPGYVSTVAQYGLDQLTFAISQGEYTALGATPQTFVQNLLGSASPLLQFSAASQAMYNTVNIQNDLFATNAQMLQINNYMNSFSSPFAVTGFAAGNTAFGPTFSSLSMTAFNNTTLVDSIGQGIDVSQASGLNLNNHGLGSPGIDNNALTDSVSTVSNGAPSLFGQSPASGNQSVVEHGAGALDTASSVIAAPTTNPAAALGGGTPSSHDQVQQVQSATPVSTISLAAFSSESMSVKVPSADPFAHYSHLAQGDQVSVGAIAVDHGSALVQEVTSAATAITGGSFISGFHFPSLADSHEGQPADVHVDAVAHALQHAVTAGGHLV